MTTTAISAANGTPAGSNNVPTQATTADFAGPIDVGGGRTIYLECHGNGTPTVVLLSGWGNAGDTW